MRHPTFSLSYSSYVVSSFINTSTSMCLRCMRCDLLVITYLMWPSCQHVGCSANTRRGDRLTSFPPGSLRHTVKTKQLCLSQLDNNNQRHLCVGNGGRELGAAAACGAGHVRRGGFRSPYRLITTKRPSSVQDKTLFVSISDCGFICTYLSALHLLLWRDFLVRIYYVQKEGDPLNV